MRIVANHARYDYAVHRRERATIDRAVPSQGLEKRQRIDLGLELLAVLRKPGEAITLRDIAVWCGCTNMAIRLIEKRALLKLANRLHFGSARALGAETIGPVTELRRRRREHA